jgi:hypothetical protein
MIAAMPKTTRKKKGDTSGVIDRSKTEHVDFINQQNHLFSEASNYFVKETNETERALCAQVMLVDTVLLTGTLIAIANKDLFNLLTTPVRILVILALFFLLISISFGVMYYFAIIGYNKRWAIAKHRASMAFLDSKIKTWGEMSKKTDGYQTGIPEELEQTLLRIQIVFIGAAALYYVVALFGLLFNVSDIISHF